MKMKEVMKEVLKEEGISQYRMAERLGENYVKVNRMLNTGNPTLNTIKKWLRVLNCELIIKTSSGKEYKV